jgi:hypothetical protein
MRLPASGCDVSVSDRAQDLLHVDIGMELLLGGEVEHVHAKAPLFRQARCREYEIRSPRVGLRKNSRPHAQ